MLVCHGCTKLHIHVTKFMCAKNVLNLISAAMNGFSIRENYVQSILCTNANNANFFDLAECIYGLELHFSHNVCPELYL